MSGYEDTFKEVKSNRSTWDVGAISAASGDDKSMEELRFIRLCNSYNQDVRYYFLPCVSVKGVYATHDAELVSFALDRKEAANVGRIEFECGTNQHMWKTSIGDVRNAWPYGLNYAARKNTTNAEVFIKYNPSQESFFAIDLVWFRKQIEAGLVIATKKEHSFPGKTCNIFYSIPWSMVDANKSHVLLDDFRALPLFIWNILNGGN